MYFVIGLSVVAALIFVIWLIAKVMKFLVVAIARSIKRLVSFRRKPRAKQNKVPPTVTLPAVDRDWEAISRATRRSLLKSGPRANRETVLLSDHDLGIAIELKEQELQRLKADFERMGRCDDSWNRPVRPAARQPSDGTRVVQTSRFMH